MVILGQKLKMQKTCEKRIYKTIRVVLCKKPLECLRNMTILKIAHLAKGRANAKAIAFQKRQFESKIKNAKNMGHAILQEH